MGRLSDVGRRMGNALVGIYKEEGPMDPSGRALSQGIGDVALAGNLTQLQALADAAVQRFGPNPTEEADAYLDDQGFEGHRAKPQTLSELGDYWDQRADNLAKQAPTSYFLGGAIPAVGFGGMSLPFLRDAISKAFLKSR